MKRKKVFTKTRGYLTATGATAKEAKDNLEKMIDWACAVASPVVESRFGLVLIVAATQNGYCTNVFDPKEMTSGSRRDCFNYHPQGSYSNALLSARMHAAQNAWRHTDNDLSFIGAAGLDDVTARDLASWIAFQRSYTAEKSAGKSDALAFNIAIGLDR